MTDETKMDATEAKPHELHLPDRAEEARNLASEGLEEIQHGNKDEGKFLIDEAKALDKAAAESVVNEK